MKPQLIDGRLRSDESSGDVGTKYIVELAWIEMGQATDAASSGIEDHAIETSESIDERVNGRSGVDRIGRVAGQRDSSDGGSDFLDGLLAPTHNTDAPSLLGKQMRSRSTDACTSTRDERNPLFSHRRRLGRLRARLVRHCPAETRRTGVVRRLEPCRRASIRSREAFVLTIAPSAGPADAWRNLSQETNMAKMNPQSPGVYINELDAFPNSVVEVPTAVPAFIGHTAVAESGSIGLTSRPTRITNMAEYLALYSTNEMPPAPPLAQTIDLVAEDSTDLHSTNPYLLYRSLQLFYANGGGPCWIVSVGSYTDPLSADAITAGIDELDKEPEPTIIVTPDAVNLVEPDWQKVTYAAVDHCQKKMSRVTILDIWGGQTAPTPTYDPVANFRNFSPLPSEGTLSYAMTYWPWLNTRVIEAAELDYTALTNRARAALGTALTAEATAAADQSNKPVPQGLTDAITQVTGGSETGQPVTRAHRTMLAVSPIYQATMSRALDAANLMPPGSAMAGVYTAVDNTVGVWKAPANVALNAVNSPFLTITDEEQADLNVPLDGKAVNAIRTFPGRGILVWGARTLDGNSQDWRYINVRRTMIMLEQSIKAACEAYVFAPNTSTTWTTVRAMIENFLNNQWKAGALAGNTAADSYRVEVGLGSTMTAEDILAGYMRVMVSVALTYPAEFIVLTFEQQMQVS